MDTDREHKLYDVAYNVGDVVQIKSWDECLGENSERYIDSDGDICFEDELGYFFHSQVFREGTCGTIVDFVSASEESAAIVKFDDEEEVSFSLGALVNLGDRNQTQLPVYDTENWVLLLNSV